MLADSIDLIRDLKVDPVLTTIRTTEDLLSQIELREQNFEAFRQKKAKLWRFLRRSMTGIELLGGLTQNALTLTPFSMASPVLGAVLFLVSSAKGVSEAYDSIIYLLSELEDFTERLQEYARAAIDPKLQKKVVKILTNLLEIFARSEELIKKGRFKKYMSVTFLGDNEKIAKAMAHLRSLIDAETKLVGSLVYSTVLKTNDSVDRSGKAMERNEKVLQGVAGSMNEFKKVATEEAEQERLEKALNNEVLTIVQAKHRDIEERVLGGTGNWVKEEPLYQEWIKEEALILWVLGGPGAGKSFLSSRMISHLREIHPQDPQHPSRVSVGYFYIKEDDEQLRSVNVMLKSVSLQIANQNPIYKKHAVNICESGDRISTAKSTWQNLFLGFFGSQQNKDSAAFIIIDGLDEAPKAEREIFLQLLRSLEDYRGHAIDEKPRLHFTVVGRPEIRESINSTWESGTAFIAVSAVKNKVDIEEYIAVGIRKVKALTNKRISMVNRKALRDEIIDKLREGANGMFLWVNLMLEQIRGISRPSDIKVILKEAPHNLTRMIRHVFERLAGDHHVQKKDLNEILIWVTFARRRLLLGEMDVILKLRPPVDEGMPDLEDNLREQFASLFILDREDNLTTETLQLRIRGDLRQETLLVEHGSDEGGDFNDVHEAKEDLYEEDPSQKIESDFTTTFLGFSHASIRDYLIQEGNPATRIWPVDLGIGYQVNQAEHHITESCLSILCDSEHDIHFPDTSMSGYAGRNFLKHLQALERSSLDKSEKQAIIRPLFAAFHDESIMDRWIDRSLYIDKDSVHSLLQDSKLTQCMRDWFADEDLVHSDFTSHEIHQMQNASTSVSNLFEPIARFCAAQWLKKDKAYYHYLYFYVLFLDVYLSLNDNGSQENIENYIDLEWLQLRNLSLKRLRLLAEFGGFEKCALWHRRLAEILEDATYIDAAIREYNMSIKMDDQDSMTFEGMASCYEIHKDYHSAIGWEQQALAVMSQEFKPQGLQKISNWRIMLDDVEGAIEASHQALSLAPKDTDIIMTYLSALKSGSKFQEIMEFTAQLEATASTEEGEDMLSRLFIQQGGVARDVIGIAAGISGKTDWVAQFMKNAIAVAERRNDPEDITIQYCRLAAFLSLYAFKADEAIDAFEVALRRASRGPTEYLQYTRWLSVDHLSQLYYNKASAAERIGSPFNQWISKLENLAKEAEVDQDEFDTNGAALGLGIWYRLHGRLQEAKSCFRPRMLCDIDLLTDDVEDDFWRYQRIAWTLLRAGDKENAAAAFAIAINPLHKRKTIRQAVQQATDQATHSYDKSDRVLPYSLDIENSIGSTIQERSPALTNRSEVQAAENAIEVDLNEPDLEEVAAQVPPFSDWSEVWTCAGRCNRKVGDWQGIYCCEICIDSVCWCDECIELVRGEKLPFSICDARHTFYQAYPVSEQMRDIAAVKMDGKVKPRKEWVEALRKEWVA